MPVIWPGKARVGKDVVSRRGRLAFRNTDLGLKWAASSARLMYLKVFKGRV